MATVINITQRIEATVGITKDVWVTASREYIPVSQMSTNHINNCIRCWNGEGQTEIPAGYLGGKEKWLKIFYNELAKRQ